MYTVLCGLCERMFRVSLLWLFCFYFHIACLESCLESENHLSSNNLSSTWTGNTLRRTEITSQNSLFYTFIHKHLKQLTCFHRTETVLFQWRGMESESCFLHYHYGRNSSSHWVPLHQDITILLGGWNKQKHVHKPPRFHAKAKQVGEDGDSRLCQQTLMSLPTFFFFF